MSGAPKRLRCEYLENPLGIDELRPRLSWWLDDERPAEVQTAYHILAASRPELLTEDAADLWDSGRTASSSTCQIEYAGRALASRQRVWWKVRAFDSDGIGSPWSRLSYFEAGLLGRDDWRARWIGAPLLGGKRTPVQVPVLRRSFELSQRVRNARLYVTALGTYDIEINGTRAIDVELAPGWTDYRKRVGYRTFDVTPLLQEGENVIGAWLGDGWYCGTLGLSDRQQYGERPLLLAQLEATLTDGTLVRVATDDLWTWRRSPILYSDLLLGESCDARQALGAWSEPRYDAAGWTPVDVVALDPGVALIASANPPVRVIERRDAIGAPRRLGASRGVQRLVYDFGQNVVGRVRLTIRAPRGTLIEIRHAERLDERGEPCVANRDRVVATDFYTCAGDGVERYEPRFTYHGFQFVELSGRFDAAAIEAVTAVVLGTALPETGAFECDHALLNQLQSNIQWSARGNFLDVPTDSPQLDARLGWAVGAQLFARTAAFNFDVASFFGKWLVDLTDAQSADGNVPPLAPLPPMLEGLYDDAVPGWSDAIVICPWTIYRCCGDRRILERNYAAMTAFVANLEARHPTLIRGGAATQSAYASGDWLATEASAAGDPRAGTTAQDLIGTAYFCYSAKLLARIAGVLGNVSDFERYEALTQRIRAAFRRRFVTAEGRVVGETQTAYVLSLHFGLLDRDEIDVAVAALARDIEARGVRPSTGLLGTAYLLPVLTNHGRLDLAYRLLLNVDAPGWLYPVTQGATTIWGRWDAGSEADADPRGTGINHCARGAVGEWLYGAVAGLELDPDLAPGRNAYRRVRIQPRPPREQDFPKGVPIRYAKATLDSEHGRYEVEWEISHGRFVLNVRIPPNCAAKVILPNDAVHDVVAGRHEFRIPFGVLADVAIPVLSEVTGRAS